MLSDRPRISYGQTELLHTIRRCGLTSNLKLCLDAGDANSYSGSGQSWLDTSGNGYDFYRGATSSSEGSDPTFNGTAGRRSSTEYWSFDGGDFFRYDSANETWMQNLHKASAKFTLLAWVYYPTLSAEKGLFGTAPQSINIGIFWSLRTTPDQLVAVYNGSGTVFIKSGSIGSSNVWHMLAVSLDATIGANGAIFYADGVATLQNSTYTSPSASSATYTSEIGAEGNAVSPLLNTTRLGMFAAWEGVALTQAQLNSLYQYTRGRFGV